MDKNTAYQVISQFKENNCNSEALLTLWMKH